MPTDYLWVGVHNDTAGVPGDLQKGIFFMAMVTDPEASWTGNWVQYKPPLTPGAPDNIYYGSLDVGTGDGLIDIWMLNLDDPSVTPNLIGVLDAKELHCDEPSYPAHSVEIILFDSGFIELDRIQIHQIPELDFGDAPEDCPVAYPSLPGVIAWFPTCMWTGYLSWVQHATNLIWFGPGADFETNGNAGTCPHPNCFPLYDQDECFADGDAGLMYPEPYTIIGPAGTESVVPCPLSPTGTALGNTCQWATWGVDIDIDVTNWSAEDAYVNVLMDWNHTGEWSGASDCFFPGDAPEHVLVDWPVSAGYSGPLSGDPLYGPPPGFLIGPEAGYVWTRFTITDVPIGYTDWTGEGVFDDGETEDYLLLVEEVPANDLGDAPDSSNNSGALMTAYPAGGPLGIQANYPTVYLTGSPPHGPKHQQPLAVAYLGTAVTLENEADIGLDQDPNNNIDPPGDWPDRDGADDGVPNLPLGLDNCNQVTFDYLVNVINPDVNLYVNVWFDWTRDGDWDDNPQCPNDTAAPEWAVQDQLLAAGSLSVGPNQVTTPAFMPWHPAANEAQPIWMRITLSEQPWTGSGSGGSGPVGGYLYGETEDYYFLPKCPSCADLNCDGRIDNEDFVIFALQWLDSCP